MLRIANTLLRVPLRHRLDHVRIAAGGVAAVGLVIAAALWCAPVAGALPDVIGKTYDDAVSILQGAGHTAIVSSTFGSRLPQSECIVTNATDHKMLRPAGDENFYEFGWGEVMLSLNCNGGYANGLHPGSSVGSPEGRKARDYEAEIVARHGDGTGLTWV